MNMKDEKRERIDWGPEQDMIPLTHNTTSEAFLPNALSETLSRRSIPVVECSGQLKHSSPEPFLYVSTGHATFAVNLKSKLGGKNEPMQSDEVSLILLR